MDAIKKILIYTNPITYIVGAPLLIGFILSAMLDGVISKTAKIIRRLEL
jgi:hypothetical protein